MIDFPALPPATTVHSIISSSKPALAVSPRTVKVYSEFGSITTFCGVMENTGGGAGASPFLGGAEAALDHERVCARRPRFSRVNSREQTRCEKVSPKKSASRA